MRRAACVLVAGVVLAGCEAGTEGLEDDVLLSLGTYAAEGSFGVTTFTTRDGAGDDVVDWLARGASIRLDLRSDMITRGRLFIPGGDEDGSDMDEDLAGTWSVSGDQISLDHEADTFLRDMTFTRFGDELRGRETFGEVTIDVVLERR